MSELQLIGAPASNYVWAVRIACAEKGVAHTLIPGPPHTPEVDAIHPFGKIPVLRHGEVALCESRAICAYIDRAFAGPALIPNDAQLAAQVEQWISIVNTHVDLIVMRRYVIAYLFPKAADGSADRAAIDGVAAEMRICFAALDAAVASTGHLVAGTFTLADINLLPILFYMNKMPESRTLLAQFRHLQAYFDQHYARPSVQSTRPVSFPGTGTRFMVMDEAA